MNRYDGDSIPELRELDDSRYMRYRRRFPYEYWREEAIMELWEQSSFMVKFFIEEWKWNDQNPPTIKITETQPKCPYWMNPAIVFNWDEVHTVEMERRL